MMKSLLLIVPAFVPTIQAVLVGLRPFVRPANLENVLEGHFA